MNDDGRVLFVSGSIVRLLFVVLMGGVCAVPALAQSVRRMRLDSGLSVIMRDRQVSHVVDVQVVIRAGSQYEDGLLGSGVSQLTQALVVDRLRRAQGGRLAQIAGHLRSTVDIEAVRIAVSTTDVHFEAVLRLLAEALTFRDHDVADLERHRRRLLDSLDQRGDVLAIEQRELHLTVYRRHPARLAGGGVPRLIRNVQMAQLQAYQAARYTLPNVSVIVVGHVNQDAVRRQVTQAFSALDGGGWQNRPMATEPPQLAARQHVVTAAIDRERHAIAWRTGPLIDGHDAALRVLAVLLEDPHHSPLHQALESGQLASDLRVQYRSGADYPGYLAISYAPYERRGADAWIAVQEILSALVEGGPGEPAVRAARQYLRRMRALEQASASGIGDDLARWEIALGLPTYGDQVMERVQAVDVAAIQQAVRQHVRNDNRSRIVLRPQESGSSVENAVGMVKTVLGDVTPEVSTLGSGVRVVHQYLPVGLVHLRIVIGGGASIEDAESMGVIAVLRSLFERGTSALSDDALARRLGADGMSFAVKADHHSVRLELTCFPEDAERGLQLLLSVLSQPSHEVEILERAVREAAGAVTVSSDGLEPWRRRVLERLREAMLTEHYAGHSMADIKAAIEELAPQSVVDMLRRLRTGDNIIIAVFGEVQSVRILPRIEEMLKEVRFTRSEEALPVTMAPAWHVGGHPTGTIGLRWEDQDHMAMAFAWPGPTRDELAEQQATIDLLLALLDDGIGGGYVRRAFSEQVSGWRFMVESYVGRGLVLLSMMVNDDQWGTVRRQLDEAIAVLPEFLAEIDDAALEAARQRCQSRRALAMDDWEVATNLYTSAVLRDGDVEPVTTYDDRLAAVERTDLIALARRIFAAPPMAVLMARSPERAIDDADAAPVTNEEP